MKIRPVGADVTKLVVAFRNFANAHERIGHVQRRNIRSQSSNVGVGGWIDQWRWTCL